MKCPKCNCTMQVGSPHSEEYCYQYECRCGYIIPVPYGFNDMDESELMACLSKNNYC